VNATVSVVAAANAGSGNITIQVVAPNGTNSVFTIPVTVN
jgi:hypothetical protein